MLSNVSQDVCFFFETNSQKQSICNQSRHDSNQSVRLDQNQSIGCNKRVFLGHKEIFSSVKKNTFILIDDGKIKLKIISRNEKEIKTKIIIGGKLSSNKGINLPNLILNTKPLTPKDKKDLNFILENEIDWIALSFVQNLKDVNYVKKFIKGKKP